MKARWLLGFPHGGEGSRHEGQILERAIELVRESGVSAHPPFVWLVPTARKRRRVERGLSAALAGTFRSGVCTLEDMADASCPPGTAAIGEAERSQILRALIEDLGEPAAVAPVLLRHTLTVRRIGDFFHRLKHAGIVRAADLDRRIAEYRSRAPASKPRCELDRWLSQLFGRYGAFLAKRRMEDPADRVLALSSDPPRRPRWLPERIKLLAVEGFYDLTDAQARAVLALAKSADEVRAALDVPSSSHPAADVMAGMLDALNDLGSPSPLEGEGRVRSPKPRSDPVPGSGVPHPDPKGKVRPTLCPSGQSAAPATARRQLALDIFTGPTGASLPNDLRLVEAEDRRDEVRFIAREIRALASRDPALPLDEIAVVFPAIENYAPLVEEVFREHAIEFAVSLRPPMAARPVVRSLLGLLRAVVGGYERGALLGLLGDGILDFPHAGVPFDADSLETLRSCTAEAGIRGGGDGGDFEGSYLRPLQAMRRSRELALRRLPDEIEAGQTHPAEEAKLRTQVEALKTLIEALAKMHEFLAPLTEDRGPADHAKAVCEVLDKLRVEERAASLAPGKAGQGGGGGNRAAARSDLASFRQALFEAAALCGAADPERRTPARDFLQTIEEVLDGRRAAPAHWNDAGVQVMGALETRGMTFRRMFLGGLVEGEFPAPETGDPLFPPRDSVRGIPARDISRELDGRFLFVYNVLNGTEGCVLSWPRFVGDARSVPSPFVRALRLAAGGPTAERPAAPPALVEATPGAANAPDLTVRKAYEDAGALIGAIALDTGAPDPAQVSPLVALARTPGHRDPVLRALHATRLLAHRAEPTDISAYSGHLSGPAAAEALERAIPAVHLDKAEGVGRGPRRLVSATLLESYAGCPARFFFERIVGLGEEPELVEDLPGDERGRLIHRVLARFHEAHRGKPIRSLADALGQVCAELEAEAREALKDWEFIEDPFLSALRGDLLDGLTSDAPSDRPPGMLREFLQTEMEMDSVLAPNEVEVKWVVPAPPDTVSALPKAFGKGLCWVARIDRCDAPPANAHEVRKAVRALYDYKTGSGLPGIAGMLDGYEFQLPFYVLVAREKGLEPCIAAVYQVRPREAVRRRACLWLSKDASDLVGRARKGRGDLDLTEPGESDRFLATERTRITGILAAIAAGHFPALPVAANCRGRCPFARACRTGPREVELRKAALRRLGVATMYDPQDRGTDEWNRDSGFKVQRRGPEVRGRKGGRSKKTGD